jgi:uncharacterized Ntn-hydrolase superfamily protein
MQLNAGKNLSAAKSCDTAAAKSTVIPYEKNQTRNDLAIDQTVASAPCPIQRIERKQ